MDPNSDTHDERLSLLHVLINALPHPVLIKDEAGHYVCSNAACDEIMGDLHKNSLQGSTVADLPFIDEEQRLLFRAEHLAALGSSALHTRRVTLTPPDGRRREMLYALRRINLPGSGAPGTLVSLVDISEAAAAAQRAEDAEALLHQLTNNLPVSVFQYKVAPDGDLRTTYVTRRAYELFGLDQQECIADMAYVFETLLPEYRSGILERIQEKKFEDFSRPFEFQMYDRRDGRIRWVYSESVPEKLPDGTVVCNGYWVDITERKALEADLLHAKEVAEAASKAKAMFLANMSHEIRTPMNAILGMSYLALKGNLPQKERSYVENIQTAAKSLLGIIDSILDSSKIEAGKLVIEETNMNLHEIVAQAMSLASIRSQEKGLILNHYIDPRIPHHLRGDPLRLGQVLTNLIGNAIKFTERGYISITVELSSIIDGEYGLLFSVEDTGIGMTSEQCAQLFQAFTQVDGSTTRRYGGTGLGLSISKELVELMGGEIHVSSIHKEGSTFSFLIHLKEDFEHRSFEELISDDHYSSPDFGGLTVLVAEDNEFNQIIAQELLTAVNLKALIVDSGRAAIDFLYGPDGDKVSLVLMDLQLPDIDGYEATIRLRSDQRFLSLPIVAMTAHAMSEERERCLRLGMNEHISKPIDPIMLYRALDKWLPNQGETKPAADISLKPVAKKRSRRIR